MGNSGFEIRIGKTSDVDVLARFNSEMAYETEGLALNAKKLEAGIAAPFEDPDKGFYVVAENPAGEVVGGLMVTFEWSNWRNGWFWWITSVFVDPEARGAGVYRELYEFVKEKAKHEGSVCGFRLYVDKDNSVAQEVYRNVGMDEANYLVFEEEI